MDRFDAMRVFTRIVERRSFTKAADDLGLPRSSVTDAVQGLEMRLGVRLLQRTTRQVSPTLDGEAYYQRCVSLIATGWRSNFANGSSARWLAVDHRPADGAGRDFLGEWSDGPERS